MELFIRPLMAATVVAVGVGLLSAPGAAFAADPAVPLSAAEMSAAVRSVVNASATAAKDGWAAAVNMPGRHKQPTLVAYDAVNDTASFRYPNAYLDTGEPLVQTLVPGRGWYNALNTHYLKVVAMMGKPAVTSFFEPNRNLDIDSYFERWPVTPTNTITAEDAAYAGTKATHTDGSVDYTFTMISGRYVVHATSAGTLAGVEQHVVANGVPNALITTFTYGPQTVPAPAPNTAITLPALIAGDAYYNLPDFVRYAADGAAKAVRDSARGKTVSVATLRRVASVSVADANRRSGGPVAKITDVRGGVRIAATNPYTKKTVAYTLKASGKKAIVARA